ncbi:HalOD1 output domain-containing protein [Natronoglomus mannanivorans]|uniref:Halobacterial output domain-containing protein n=1 Tax=Natronoglomus mannanivorans TaxID=2979990 RepID=A0AAP2Z2E9_9EURY|nr:hypothetical protein [Halobacteria archaeon AArc-xg1-1]
MNAPAPTRTHDPISVRVVTAVAEAAGTDPIDLEPPLYHSVDPEALDRLLCTGLDGQIRFEYRGYTVTVQGDGTVSVDGVTDTDSQ